MSIDNNPIVSILLISNGTISVLAQLIMLRFLLNKKTKSVIVIQVIALVATNCINSMCYCYLGMYNLLDMKYRKFNFTTPQFCMLTIPNYQIATISARQSPMIILCIAIVQLRNACFIKCSTKRPLLKTIILLCGICMLNICISGIVTYYSIHGSAGQRKISTKCVFNEVFPFEVILSDGATILLLNCLSVLFCISAVLIIRSKFSSYHVIREIQSIRQKAILKRLKITTSSQLLHSSFLVSCTVAEFLLRPSSSTIYYFWSISPLFTAVNTVIYTNQVVAVMDHIKEIYCNFEKWLNCLYNSLFHSFLLHQLRQRIFLISLTLLLPFKIKLFQTRENLINHNAKSMALFSFKQH
ncbi:hypothetical protein T11_7743 [Trichinella zimbabwensis]|uniref:Uncharacterized protein n=1 Tax=Trichinella zimbabwensis TaxID=268475 RepID=A0A0V1HA77_9BILA|nr:hypothetical protein T11_7743 [Trichinella zimbabwensis]